MLYPQRHFSCHLRLHPQFKPCSWPPLLQLKPPLQAKTPKIGHSSLSDSTSLAPLCPARFLAPPLASDLPLVWPHRRSFLPLGPLTKEIPSGTQLHTKAEGEPQVDSPAPSRSPLKQDPRPLGELVWVGKGRTGWETPREKGHPARLGSLVAHGPLQITGTLWNVWLCWCLWESSPCWAWQ